jgi:sugar lactone lactonase YvrE
MKIRLSFSIVPFLGLALSLADGQNILVTNFGVNTITSYDLAGNGVPFTTEFVNGPNGIAIDTSGNVYVSTNSNVIRKFSQGGTDLGVFTSVGINNALGLVFDSSGNLYAANFGGNTVEKFDPDGIDLGTFALVLRPTGMAFDSSGNLCVASFDNSIHRFAPDGTPLSSFTSPALLNPEGIAFDPTGLLYVANNASNTIEIFSSSGADLGALNSTGLNGPTGIAFDGNENLYVVNTLAATVEKFSADGTESFFATTGFQPAFIAVQQTSKLVNISTRLNILTGEDVLDSGVIIVGSGTKTILIRGLGPSLADGGLEGVLADPIIELHGGSNNEILASNDNWKNNQQLEIEATGIAPTKDAEAALITSLGAGAYTVIERGKQSTTGIGLLEIYDLAGTDAELVNMSTRGFVDTGSNVMIVGFIAQNTAGGSGEFLVRALGPSLGAAGVSDPLADPVLELHDSNGTLIGSNDNWRSDQQSEIEATGIPPTNDAEAAILANLLPGPYTGIESGRDGGTGIGLVEVYNLH